MKICTYTNLTCSIVNNPFGDSAVCIDALVANRPNNRLTSLTVRQEQSSIICGVIISFLRNDAFKFSVFKSIGKCPSGEELFTTTETVRFSSKHNTIISAMVFCHNSLLSISLKQE